MSKKPAGAADGGTKPAQRREGAQTPGDEVEPTARQAFGRTFWMLNSIEMFERLAYFGIRSVVPLYIMQADEPGGLHMTAVHKGWVYMWWAILQSWLPMFTGGIADRYGYKRVLVGAISTNVIGYLMMAGFHSYYGFFAGILVLAAGTAFFKPALQGSIAQNLTKKNSSMGWGLFYWVVNVGAVLAPVIATIILGKPHSAEGWRNLFLASAIYTALNLLLLLTFKDVPSGADKTQSLVKVFSLTIENIWPYWFRGGSFHKVRGPIGIVAAVLGLGVLILASQYWLQGAALMLVGVALAVWLRGGVFTWQLRLPAFLLIMSCFWMMMYQLWDLHPNFIEDWIDSSMVAEYVPTDSWREYGDRGLVQVPQQILLNLNAALIVLLIVPISWLVRKMRTLEAMLIGMSVATIGILVAGLTGNGWVFLLGVGFFSLGEMLTGPKKNQYLGLIAPPGKKGLYLGYVNIPIGIGVGFGSMIAGILYDDYGEKASLALKELASEPKLVARAAQSSDWSDALHKLPPLLAIDRDDAFRLVAGNLGGDTESAAAHLRSSFENDTGQITNLALQYLALSPANRDKTLEGIAGLIAEPQAHADDVELLRRVSQQLSGDTTDGRGIDLARFVHLLPQILDIKPVAVFDAIRMEINAPLPDDQKTDDSRIVDSLWERFGDDPGVRNNLALEYLAQSTDTLAQAVARMTYRHPPTELHERIREIDERIGIGRTKSFSALSMARGAEDTEVEEALAAVGDVAGGPQNRVFTYLMQRPHYRFRAVGRKDWGKDKSLLREIIRNDPASLEIVLADIDKEGRAEGIMRGIKNLFGIDTDQGVLTEEGVSYTKLAGKRELIQRAMDAKDWSASPKLAAQVLGLNPFEARALMSAEVGNAHLATTHFLWDKYQPQYHVWIPFAAVGVLAAIALAIFGQMAKRWKDMNA